MNSLKTQLEQAFASKKNDVNSFIWKLGKKEVNGVLVQDSIKMMDASPEQLNSFYNHCMSMLHSTDKNNPGRYVLLDIIKDQQRRCNAELFLRYLENTYNPSDRPVLKRFMYLTELNQCILNNKDVLKDKMDKPYSIDLVTAGVQDEFKSLDIDVVRDACMDMLGFFNHKHITRNFILKMGIWFTDTEMADLTEKDNEGNIRNRLDVVKERLNLKPDINIYTNPKGLSFEEFRAMINLKGSKKYSSLTTNQLVTIKNKILFRLFDDVKFHIDQWEERIEQILKVAQEKGINIEGQINE